MIDQDTINDLAQFYNYDLNNNLTLINIVQKLYSQHKTIFPIKENNVQQLQNKILKYFNYDANANLSQNLTNGLFSSLAKNSFKTNNVLDNSHLINQKYDTDFDNEDLRNNGIVDNNKIKQKIKSTAIIDQANYDSKTALIELFIPQLACQISLAKGEMLQIKLIAINKHGLQQDKSITLHLFYYTNATDFFAPLDKLESDLQYLVFIKTASHDIHTEYISYFLNNYLDALAQIDFLIQKGKLYQFSFKNMVKQVLSNADSQASAMAFGQYSYQKWVEHRQNGYHKSIDYYENNDFYDDRLEIDPVITKKNMPDSIRQNLQFILDHQQNFYLFDEAYNKITLQTSNPEIIELIKAYFVLINLFSIQNKPLKFYDSELMANILAMIHEQTSNTTLTKLITQAQKEHKSLLEDEFNEDTKYFLQNYRIKFDADRFKFSVLDLVRYMYHLTHNLPFDDKMLGLLNYATNNNYVLFEQATKYHLQNKLTLINGSKQKRILSLMPKHITHNSKNSFEIYQINGTVKPQNYCKHLRLIHGTSDFSVLSILGRGLLTFNELRNNNQISNEDWLYTGSGLGNGIYFAQLNQMEKSLSYTLNSNKNNKVKTEYLFICDVYYNTVQDVNSYNTDLQTKCDLIWGHGIGITRGQDELVAKSSKQVQLKYLVKIRHYLD